MILFLYFLLFIIIVKKSILKIDINTQFIDIVLVMSIVIYAIVKINLNQTIGNWGTDQLAYYYHFFLPIKGMTITDFATTNFSQKELGFKVLLWIIVNIKVLTFVQFQVVMFLLELVPIFIISYIINHNRYLDIILFSYVVYPFFANGATNVLRQGFALGILMIAYLWTIKNIDRENIIKILSGSSVIIAALFHQTALILALLWLVVLFTRKKVKLYHFWIVTAIFAFLDVTNLNQRVFSSMGSLFSDNYDLYVDSTAQATYGSGSKYLFLLISLVLAIVLGYLFKQVKAEEKEKAELLLKQYLGSISAFFAFSFIAFADRVGMYAWTIAPMIAFYFIDKIEDSKSRRFFLIMIPIFCLLLGYGMNSGSYFVNR